MYRRLVSMKQLILDYLNKEKNFSLCKVIKQHWVQGSYSYMQKPRPDHGIMLLLSGKMDFVTNKETISVKKGDIIFLPKNSHYTVFFDHEAESVDDYLVNFDTTTEFPTQLDPICLFENASHSFADLFKQLFNEKLSNTSSLARIKGIFYLLLDAIITMQKRENPKLQKILDKAQELLKSDDELSIPEIARACCVSESSLRRIFCQHLGISPVRYRLQTKLNRAMHLLNSKEMSINEIANSLNFYDTAYFIKVFQEHTGMTPRQYIKNRKL